jgi:hypothetical protein
MRRLVSREFGVNSRKRALPSHGEGANLNSLRKPQAGACGLALCAEHVRQLGGESPLYNLMEVK